MAQKTIDGSKRHREEYMRALKNGVESGDLTQYQADKLRRDYNNGGEK